MAKKQSAKKAAAAAALQITHDCTRDSFGFGALPGLGIEAGSQFERPDVSALKARLLAAGFESTEESFVERLDAMADGDEKDALSDSWDDGNVAGWNPRPDSGGWTMAAVMFIDGKAVSGEADDAVAVFARPAGMVDQVPDDKPWPFPKTEGGGPNAHSDASITEGGGHEVAPPPAITKSEAHLGRKAAQFDLPDPIEVLLKSFTPRVEKHGDDDVSASSFGFVITAPNTILDRLSPALRHIFYAAPEGQVTLPGVEESTPLLRTKLIESVKLSNIYEGWTMRVHAGMDDDDPFVIGGCKVDKFALELIDGGSTKLAFRVGSSDLDEHEAGWFYGHLGQTIVITLHAPEVKQVIDGTVGHPGLAAMDVRDAGDLFAEQHGGESADGDQDREFATEGAVDNPQDGEQETAEA